MSTNIFKTTLLTSLFFISVACEELYYPDIDTQASLYVFEGFISDEAGPFTLKITKSTTFNSGNTYESATGFQVQIQDSNGTITSLTQRTRGEFITPVGFIGQLNHFYRLIATDSEGNIYHSTFEQLLPAAPVDSLSGAYDVEEWLETVEGAGTIVHQQEGTQIKNFSSTKDFTPFYRYEYQVIFQTTQLYPTSPFKTICYIARPVNSLSTGFISVANSNLFAEKNIGDHPVTFISSLSNSIKVTLDSIELDTAGNPLFTDEEIVLVPWGFFVKVKQYSLTETGFSFWDAINSQINATGQVFDPVESQIKGNITCVTDTTQRVFGYFGASAVTHASSYFYLKSNHQVYVQPVDSFPDVSSTIMAYDRFDFWID